MNDFELISSHVNTLVREMDCVVRLKVNVPFYMELGFSQGQAPVDPAEFQEVLALRALHMVREATDERDLFELLFPDSASITDIEENV